MRWQPAGPPALNDIDPLSGKAVDRYSPRVTYENYTIGFCCEVSKRKWVRLSKEDKDASILRFVPQSETGK